MAISCCRSTVHSISSRWKQPQWLVCSCHSSNVFATNLREMAVERDALGKASVKLLHKRSPWMHHTWHALPLQCRKLKHKVKERNPRKGWQTWTCCVQFRDIMPHYLLILNFQVWLITTQYLFQQHGERGALIFFYYFATCPGRGALPSWDHVAPPVNVKMSSSLFSWQWW